MDLMIDVKFKQIIFFSLIKIITIQLQQNK